MKFRIIRDYDEFQPQVFHITSSKQEYWENIGHYHCYTLEEAERCAVITN